VQGPAGLGEVDHGVHDLGRLRFGGAIAQPHVRVHAALSEEPPGELGVLARHPHPVRQVGERLELAVIGHRHHDAHRPRRGLGVPQLAERYHVAVCLLDPVAPGDAQVEQPVSDIGRDLLGSQDAHVVDARVVDVGAVVHRRAPPHRQVRIFKELQGRRFERALGEHELEHGR